MMTQVADRCLGREDPPDLTVAQSKRGCGVAICTPSAIIARATDWTVTRHVSWLHIYTPIGDLMVPIGSKPPIGASSKTLRFK